MIHFCMIFIDQNQMISMKIANQSGCRINNKRSASDDQSITALNSVDRSLHHGHIEPFSIQNDFRLHQTSAFWTTRNTELITVCHQILKIHKMSALQTTVAVHASVKFINLLTA